jgi:hypothetical protein
VAGLGPTRHVPRQQRAGLGRAAALGQHSPETDRGAQLQLRGALPARHREPFPERGLRRFGLGGLEQEQRAAYPMQLRDEVPIEMPRRQRQALVGRSRPTRAMPGE